ncbi:MAG: NAD(P)/FAD-dependent oxidoreductase [Paracoccaceae bacterium]
MERSAIVVGAGITGISVAEHLRRDGWKVTLIDRVDPGDPAQASYGNGGIIARCAVVPVAVPGLLAKAPKMLLDSDSPLFMRWSYLPRLLPWLVPFLLSGRRKRLREIVAALASLTLDSVDQHLTLAKGTGAERFIKTGEYCYLYRTRKGFLGDALGFELRRSQGLDCEERDGDALRNLDPNLSEQYRFGAIFRDHGWISSPGEYVAALARYFAQAGGVLERGEVADIQPGNPVRVTLAGGAVREADKVVLAAGVWSREIAGKLGHDVNMESERGYHLELGSPSFKPPIPYMVAEAKFVITPMEQSVRLAGIVEYGGLGAGPSAAPTDLLRRQIAAVYPKLRWQEEEPWMGHRPSTSDSLPVLGPVPGAEGVICAFGSQHIGLTIGPRVGRIIADLASGRKTNVDLAPYAVERFSRHGKSREKAEVSVKQAGGSLDRQPATGERE